MTVPVSIRATNGSGPTSGTVEIGERTLRERLRQSGLILAAALIVGLLFLPVPLIHLFGVLAAVGGTVFAVRRFRVRALVLRAAGQCPSCLANTTFFTVGGLRAARWPFTTSCFACGIGVQLEPMAESRSD